ncbi:MAG: Hsp70 family protein, partial [Candidatus Ornithomonoglobus sp.]
SKTYVKAIHNVFTHSVTTLRNYGEFGTKVEKITFDTFEEIVTPVIKDKVLNVIDTAMQKAGTTAAGIDVVVMSGGSSELRPFEKAIMNIFKDKVILPKDAQWAVAKGAAMLAMSGSKLYLNDNVGVVMSDMSVYPVLIKNQDYAGIKKPPIAFALMEDSYSAQFVFANSNNTALYGTLDVKTKGYLGEKLKLEASIDDSQIATIIIKNRAIGENYSEKIEFNKLPFYYNLMDLPE